VLEKYRIVLMIPTKMGLSAVMLAGAALSMAATFEIAIL
jgi:hypothetical protein